MCPDTEMIVIQIKVFVLFLPCLHPVSISTEDAETFDEIIVIEGFHFKSHKMAPHLLHLLSIIAHPVQAPFGDKKHKWGSG